MNNDRTADASSGFVLICEDEPRLASLTADLLEDHGFRMVTADAGEAALRVLAVTPVRVVLLDVNINGGMSTGALLDALSGTPSAPRVVLTSGLALEDVPQALLGHRLVSGYLAKPYSIDDLVAAVRAAAAG